MALKRPALFAACIAVFAALVFVISSYVSDEARPGHAGPLTDPTDLVAFYCGGKSLAERVDPYRAEPQRSCERRAFAESRIRLMEHLVMPETLPPYAIVPFALLSFASFRVACVVFVLGSLAAAMATILIIVRLTRLPIVLVSLAILVSFSLASIYIGQPVPFVVAALCASALALRSGRIALASVLALPTMMEPHVGLAAMLGLFVLEKRARLTVVVGVLGLAWLSFFVGGLALNLEYLTRVVPAQALSEVANFHAQYSLTALAYQLGASETVAIRLGELCYALMLGTGVWIAARLRRSHGDAAFVVLAPPACVLVDGRRSAVRVLDRELRASPGARALRDDGPCGSMAERLRAVLRLGVSHARALRSGGGARERLGWKAPLADLVARVDLVARWTRRSHAVRDVSLQAAHLARARHDRNRCVSLACDVGRGDAEHRRSVAARSGLTFGDSPVKGRTVPEIARGERLRGMGR